jgi:SAM-dependent methyltransferase
MTADAASMQRFWNEHAPLSPPIVDPLHEGFLAMLMQAGKGKRILECGCGAGAYTSALHNAGMNITGIDFSESMLRQARTYFPQINFRQADMLNSDLGEKFDIICGTLVLHEINFENTPKLLDFLQHHLAPGGFALFHENSFFNPGFRFVRKHLVGRRFGVPKFGSEDETPFDKPRWDLYQQRFKYCKRSCTDFVLASRIHDYMIRRGSNAPWRWIDRQINKLPIDRLKRFLTYYQCIYFSDSMPMEDALSKLHR